MSPSREIEREGGRERERGSGREGGRGREREREKEREREREREREGESYSLFAMDCIICPEPEPRLLSNEGFFFNPNITHYL